MRWIQRRSKDDESDQKTATKERYEMTRPGLSENEKSLRYERYRPRRYSDPMPIFWWVRDKAYVWFILRELTSLAVAAYAVIMIIQLESLRSGPEAYEALMAWFQTPFSVALHLIILVSVIFHSITWFNLAPTAMVLRVRKRKVPGTVVVLMNLLLWILLSIGVGWLILGV